jgi:hypothetical protein
MQLLRSSMWSGYPDSSTVDVMTQRCPRVRTGTLYRFDSVSEIRAFCRRRYPSADVATGDADGEFVLVVRDAEGEDFESLIVHFEGEGTYAVMIPGPADQQTLLEQLRSRVQRPR